MSRMSVCCSVCCSVGLERFGQIYLRRAWPDGPHASCWCERLQEPKSTKPAPMCDQFKSPLWGICFVEFGSGVACTIPRREGHPALQVGRMAKWNLYQQKVKSWFFPISSLYCVMLLPSMLPMMSPILRCCSVRCSARCDAALTMNTAYHVANLSSCVSWVRSSGSHSRVRHAPEPWIFTCTYESIYIHMPGAGAVRAVSVKSVRKPRAFPTSSKGTLHGRTDTQFCGIINQVCGRVCIVLLL